MPINESSDEENVVEEVETTRLCYKHKAEIYGIRTKDYLNPPTTKKYHHSKLSHSGDNTVPYVSLSFAKTWLNQTKEFVSSFVFSNAMESTKLTNSNETSKSTATQPPSMASSSVSTRLNLLQTPWTKTATAKDSTNKSGNYMKEELIDGKYFIKENSKTDYYPARIHNAKHVLDNWTKHKKVLDPAIEVFSNEATLVEPSLNNEYGELKTVMTSSTSVVEVSGVDHLEISKNSYVYNFVFYELLLPKLKEDFCIGNSDSSCVPYYDRLVKQ